MHRASTAALSLPPTTIRPWLAVIPRQLSTNACVARARTPVPTANATISPSHTPNRVLLASFEAPEQVLAGGRIALDGGNLLPRSRLVLHHGLQVHWESDSPESNRRQGDGPKISIQQSRFATTPGTPTPDVNASDATLSNSREPPPLHAAKILPPPTLLLISPPSISNQTEYTHQIVDIIPLTQALEDGDVNAAWDHFRTFAQQPQGLAAVRSGHLHTLMGLLAKVPLHPRKVYFRMSEVINELRRRGPGRIRTWEWNAIMNFASRWFHGTTDGDYQTALDILKDWQIELRRMTEHKTRRLWDTPWDEGSFIGYEPDLATYNTLLAAAARTGNLRLYRDADCRLRDFLGSNGSGDIATCVARITFHRVARRMSHLPDALLEMAQGGLSMGTEGANALIWSYGHLDTPHVARDIYNLLLRVKPWTNLDAQERPTARQRYPLQFNPVFRIPEIFSDLRSVKPNHITFLTMLQVYSYHGQLLDAFTVLRHFFDRLESGQLTIDIATETHVDAVFRSIFVGFVKYSPPRRGSPERRMGRSDRLLSVLSAWKGESSAIDLVRDRHHVTPSPYTTDTLLWTFQSYILLSTSFTANPNAPRQLPSPKLVRALLQAVKRTVAPEDQESIKRYVWQTLLRRRIHPFSLRWDDFKDTHDWAKLRRNYDIPEDWDDALEGDEKPEGQEP